MSASSAPSGRFGGDVVMTSRDHQSGTDRLAEVAAALACDVVVNVQGDEPLLEPAMIDAAVAPFAGDPSLMMSTLRRRIDDPAEHQNPNVTKVVVDLDGFALYFSRAPIPYIARRQPAPPAWRHVGLYAYRRGMPAPAGALPPTALERAEALEQLRALEHGIRIKVVETDPRHRSAWTPRRISNVFVASSLRPHDSRPHHGESHSDADLSTQLDPSNTSSSPAASSRRSARASPPRRSARSSKAAATRSPCRSSTPTSTSIPGR